MSASPLKPADRQFGVYLGLFFSGWVAYVLLVYPHVEALGEDSLLYAAASIGVRLAVWVAPVVLMLRFSDRVGPARALGLVDNWQRGAFVGVGLSVLLLVASLLRFGWPHEVAHNVTWNSILGTSFGIGFFEEIPFRGFILQKSWTRMNFWFANALTSAIFVGFHLPGWLTLHLLTVPLVFNVFVMSFMWGAMFRYSRSLWSCIISHSANDFVSFVLFRGH